MAGAVDDDDDFLDCRDLILPLDPALIFEAPPHHFQTIVYVKRQHELLDAAIEQWIQQANDCVEHRASDSQQLRQKIASLATSHDPRGRQQQAQKHVFSSPARWTHQQRLMQALYSVGVELQECPDECFPDILTFLVPMITEPVREFGDTIARIVKSAKLYCRQNVSLHENSLQKYYSTPGKRQDPARDNQLATSAFETKKEMCKAIYALSATLNNAIIIKESFIIEKTERFLNAFKTWRTSFDASKKNISSVFSGPAKEVRKYASLMFPPVQFPQDDFKPHFARFCHSFRLPVSMRDLESLEPLETTTGRKEGYLFHRNRAGEWSRQYFYILYPQGWLMMFAKGGRDIQVANLRQTLLRPVNVDGRDYVFEICSIDVYLMESVLQAATKVDFEEWKAALSAWIPPDEDIPAIEHLKITTPPPSKLPFPRTRHISLGRVSDAAPTSPRQRMSAEFPVVKSGVLFVLEYRAKPMRSQTMVGMWKKMTCCIRSNGLFAQYNVGDTDIPFETIPLFSIPRTHISNIDSSLFSKKHCFSIRTAHHINYYTVSRTRSRNDQDVLNGWLHALKSFAKPEVFGIDAYSEYRIYRTFSVKVNDGKISKDVEAYCEITLDDERRARTGARSRHTKGIEPGTPFWRDSFIFSDLPAFRKGITINVVQVKGSKQIPIGQVDIPVHHRKEWDEGWYPINAHRTRSNQHEGDLRLKLRYEELIVLPMETYSPLLEIILNFQSNNVISRLAELVTDLEGFAKNVLHILEAKGHATVWLNSLIDEEIAQASPKSVNTLFRGNTLLTKALDAYMRLVGTEYLDDTLGDILRAICAGKSMCEVDPSRLERGHDDLKAHWRTLYQHTRACWKAVTESVPHFPRELQVVFSHLQMRLADKFKDPIPSDDAEKEDLAALARYTGVSCFVFLRLICPAILGPKLFCIMREHPEAKAHRTLTLIAKSLQGLANLVMFGNKESWMVPMNDFITENMQSLKDFIDRICMVEPMSPSRVDSGASSLRSVQIYPPQSPGSATSAVFRNLTPSHRTPNISNCSSGSGGSGGSLSSQGGGSGNGNGAATGGPGGSLNQLYMHNNQSNTSASPCHVSPGMANTTTSATSATMASSSPRTSPHPFLAGFVPDRADELPTLPYLIDLGKELASFSTTVAHLPSLTPSCTNPGASTATTGTPAAVADGSSPNTAATVKAAFSNASSFQEGGGGGGIWTGGELACMASNGGSGSGGLGSARPSYDHPALSTSGGYPGGRSSSGSGSGEGRSEQPGSLKGRLVEAFEGGGGGEEEHGGQDHDDDDDDIVRHVYRICWQLMDEVEDRVERAMELEEDRRSLSGASTVHQGSGGGGGGVMAAAAAAAAATGGRGKLSREEPRHYGGDDMAAAMAGLHPSIHRYQSFVPYPGALLPPSSLSQMPMPPHLSPPSQQQQPQQQQYLMYEQYGGDGDAAAHLAENYYYYYGMEGCDSEEEYPV